MKTEAFDLLYYLRVLKKWKRQILAPAFFIACVVLVIGLRSPRPYIAETTVFLPAGGGGGLSLNTSAFGGLMGLPSLAIGNPNVEIVLSMIHSKRMAEDIIDQFKLMEKGYGKIKSHVIEKVRRMVDTQEMKNRVTIQVTTTDPKLSSEIANFCVLNLNAINETLDITTEKPIAKIIDPATPPISPSSRKILPRALLAFSIWVTGCTFFAFFREYLNELRRREVEEQMLSMELRDDKEKEQVLL